MTSYIAKIVSKKILGEKLENKFGKEDPYFEQVPATRLDGWPTGKFKKRKKALPPGITEHDGQVLTKVKRRAHRLDLALCSFLGIRFGWSSVIALVPAIGDALDAFMAMMVFKTCCQIEGGLPNSLKLQMLFNIAFDFAVGLVPFVGDLADAMFKANTRNALILEQHLREKGKKELRKSGQPIPPIDPSSPEEFDRMRRESPPGYHSSSPSRHGTTAEPAQHGRHESVPRAPEEARVRESRGWFSHNKSRPRDVEMGQVDNRPSNTASTKQQRGERQ
ncbi:putative membrane protein [Tolypocladium ophioglossoides CBS 100239]|uniref:Putative membrane protein n=1 Tax=Tolypocladium ophioglossoides (strain CBS 100239) TaxID=1163406 RepID=A0A0L0NEX6_TOLOC|nr:putative membrane protein [Tolypocladium ophioglossoides CBS 100239]